jgi:CubicO group peptidase (beta-lactamase class C family)
VGVQWREGQRIAAAGRAHVEAGVPIADTTRFEAASVTKQFTAAAALLLIHEGRLARDQDVRPLLGEWAAGVDRLITVDHLLAHLSGVRDAGALLLLRDGHGGTSGTTREELRALLARQRTLGFAPGSRQAYSNTGYMLLARVIERVSGEALSTFTARRFFVPLGLTRTGWHEEPTALIDGLAGGYAALEGGAWRRAWRFNVSLGNGGLVTTVGDLLRWNAALAAGEVAGGPSLVRMMEAPVVLPDGSIAPFGRGLVTTTITGRREIGHDGGVDGFAAFAARYPEEGVSVAVLCNDEGADATGIGRAVAMAVGSARIEPAPASIARAPETARALDVHSGPVIRAIALRGEWIDTTRGRTLSLATRGDTLTIGALAFSPDGAGGWARPGSGRISALRDASSGEVGLVTIDPRGQRARWLRRRPLPAGVATFTPYTGIWYAEELGTAYEIRAEPTGIAVGIAATHAQRPFAFIADAPLTLPSVRPDLFVAGVFSFRFTRDRAGRLDRLIVSHERARGLVFVRASAPRVTLHRQAASTPRRR